MEHLVSQFQEGVKEHYRKLKENTETYGELMKEIDKIYNAHKNDQTKFENQLFTVACSMLKGMAEKEMSEFSTKEIFFYCDGRDEACRGGGNCYANTPDGGGCRHTTNVNHAKNFRRTRNHFFEGTKYEDEARERGKANEYGKTKGIHQGSCKSTWHES